MKLIFVKKRTFFNAKSDPKRNGLKSITFILIFGIKVYKSERFDSYEPLETSLPPRMKNPPMPPKSRTVKKNKPTYVTCDNL
ncbi:hypothetical protein LNJ03_11250 [Tenacibaculum dicentrarchi]|nr:hypothetical protein [Tenacibaculum dicentrarchi]